MKSFLKKAVAAVRTEYRAAFLALLGTAALVYFSLAIEWIIENISCRNFAHLIASAFSSFVIAAFLIHEGGRIIHIYNRRLDPRNERKKVLITGVSPVKQEVVVAAEKIARQIEDNQLDATTLSGDDGKDLGSWQQNVRALLHNREKLEHITIIPSEAVSEEQKKAFKRLVYVICKKNINITGPINYEDLEGIYRVISGVVKKYTDAGVKENDICIDVTPGLKPFSIAAATATFNHSVAFLYVTNDGNILFYDVHLGILSNT